MAKTNEEIEKSVTPVELSDNELLAVVNEIVASEESNKAEEVAKSESDKEESSEEIEKSEEASSEDEVEKGDCMSKMDEDMDEDEKMKKMKKMKKSEEEAEESEESVEKSEASEESSEEESEDLEKGNVSTPADHGQPVDGPGEGDTPDEVADHKKKKKKEKDLGFTDGNDPAGKIGIENKTGQGETKEARAKDNSKSYFKSEEFEAKIDKLLKAVDTLASFEERITALEKSATPADEEEIRKSVSAEITERVAKSFFTEAEELKKSVAAALTENEELRKSNAEKDEKIEKAVAESEELRKSLKKPASTRQAINNLDAIEKSQESEEKGRVYKSKQDIIDGLEELRKSGKISGDDLISYNVSNFMSEKTKKLLKGLK